MFTPALDAPTSDARIAEWNAVVASGDPARIAAARKAMLADLHAAIMDEDANYSVAGWKR